MTTTSDPQTTDWQIRVPDRDELRAYAEPVRLAFGGGFSDEELSDWLKRAEPDRWLGAFEPGSEAPAGAASAFSMRLTVPGGEVPVAAVTGVGVRPDQRRRGILRTLMTRQLHDVHERGEAIAVLLASEGAIYQRFGYGLAALDAKIEVPPRQTRFVRETPDVGRVRIVDEQEARALVPRVYEVARAVTPGALSRTEPWWDEVLGDPEYSRAGAGPKYRVVFEVDGTPEAYAVYRIRDAWDERGPNSVLEVGEAITTTPRSVRGLWRYLFDVDLVRTVKVGHIPMPTPLQHVLVEPRALSLIARDGLWLRLVDLPAALMARTYALADTLVLEVRDALCPWNAGRWQLRTEGPSALATATVERTDVPADLVMDSADLSAAYLGGVRPVELAAAGRMVEATPGAALRASTLFATEHVAWCATMF